MDIKILIAAHKKYWMPDDAMYLPLHVGKEGKGELGYTGDNTGENISLKNPNYCELTGIYWAWKNLTADYIGLVHYRRHFTAKSFFYRLFHGKQASVLTGEQAAAILSRYDLILPKKRHYYIETNKSHYDHAHHPEGLAAAQKAIREKYPQYAPAFEKVMNRTSAHMFNMFVMKKRDFDAYCGFLFGVLGEVEKSIDLSGYNTYEARVFGFVGERLLDVFVETHGLTYKNTGIMFMEKQNWFKKLAVFFKRKFSGGDYAQTGK